MPLKQNRRTLFGIALALFVVTVLVATIAKNAAQPKSAAPPPTAALAAFRVVNPDIDLGSPAGGVPAPGFQLRDQRAQPTALAQFRGKVVVLAFVDSHCTTICPLTTASMVQALDLLGPAAAQVQLIGINANPLATGVADVAAYTRAHGLQDRWRFLTGTLPQLEQVWREYGVYVAAVHNDIDHQPLMFLIGPRGRERTIYSSQMSYGGVAPQARVLAAAIARLLPTPPAVNALATVSEASLHYVPPLGPAAVIPLVALAPAGDTVLLGASHPHLLLFFAGWLGSRDAMAAHLAALDRYAAEAAARGWPPPVAIDESTTEPGQAVPAVAFLHTPLVADPGGRLADGYQVEDLPWYVLVSPQGRILWSHDGWLGAAALSRAVQAAWGR